MKKIYINEDKLSILEDDDKEITFYEFFINLKEFLKSLLSKPYESDVNEFFKNNDITKESLIEELEDIGIIKVDEKIEEKPKTHPFGKKLVAKHYIKYNVLKSRFDEKVKELYKSLFGNEGKLNETDCGGVMQGGGSNPSAGQYEVPFGEIQRKGFWSPSRKRNKDEDNKSISVN